MGAPDVIDYNDFRVSREVLLVCLNNLRYNISYQLLFLIYGNYYNATFMAATSYKQNYILIQIVSTIIILRKHCKTSRLTLKSL